MAGAGWREWTAGEQLTDAKMQTFLQDQSVMRFADASERTTALNGVVSEGMITYLDDLNVVEVWDGLQWTELTGDPDIFTQGTAGQFLRSLGTAGVEWDASEATNNSLGVVYGQTLPNAFQRDTLTLGYLAGGTATTTPGGQIGNIVVGNSSGTAIATAHNNTVMGHLSSLLLSSGSFNTMLGHQTGFVMNGDGNTCVGGAAGYGWGSSGNNNTAIGYAAGGTVTFFTYSGSNNTLVGYQASPSGTAVSNEITLGNASVSTLRCQATSITALSDERDKTDIAPLEYGLNFVNELNPVEFTWATRDGARVGEHDLGFIAQDLAKVEDRHNPDRLRLTLRSNPDRLEATPGRLIPILVKAIQDLSAKVEELEERLNG